MDGSKIAPRASFEGRPLVDLDEQEPVEERVDRGAGDRPFAERRAFGQALSAYLSGYGSVIDGNAVS